MRWWSLIECMGWWVFLEVWRENGRFEVVIGAQLLLTNYFMYMTYQFLIVLTTTQGSSTVLDLLVIGRFGILQLVCNFYK